MHQMALMWRMLLRDWRAGELTVLGFALLLAVAAMSSVGFLGDRVERALRLEAHQLLGGDLVLIADHAWDQQYASEARARGLRAVRSVSFPSMVGTATSVALAEIKAVEVEYPLRGKLRVATGTGSDAPTNAVPAAGEVWPDARLNTALALDAEREVTLGLLRPRLGPTLTMEPDRGMNVLAMAPRLLMNLADLAHSGLIQPGSRVTYRLHLAGPRDAIDAYAQWVKTRLGRGERLEDLENARPEVRSVVERTQRFLRLAALLAVVLAAVAVALAAARFTRRHLDACAVMRCLGATERTLLAVYGGEFVVFGLMMTVLGCGLGFLGHLAILASLQGLVFAELPAASLWPLAQGLAVGLALLVGFALPPLLRLRRVPTVRVLRREFATGDATGGVIGYLAGYTVLAGLMCWIAGELTLGLIISLGFGLALGVYALIAAAALWLLGRWRASGRAYGWRHGVARLARGRGAAVVQLAALALGLTAVLLLGVARDDLLDAWRQRAPADAPNRFLINIQPDQREALGQFLAAEGVADVRLEPMARARLMRINGRVVRPADFHDERAQRLAEREFNLSWSEELPPGNTVIAGRWTPAGSGGEFSVEQGLAQTLGLALGDELMFEIGGVPTSGRVTSLRKLSWDSMRVNFFVIGTPASLGAQPASYITSFHVAKTQEAVMVRLIQRWPNVTAIDVGALLEQLRRTLDQVAGAVQWVFGFGLLSGLAVLWSALQAGADERRHEVALLRALGARRAQVRGALWAELCALGALAGTLGALGAAAIALVLARQVFQLPYLPHPGLLGWGLLFGLVLALLGGALAILPVLRQPPLRSLREVVA